jgi:GTP-binding protein
VAFVDQVEIVVQGGRGGDGIVSFRREKFVPKGGPDGGDGGDGGNVVLVADPSVDNLAPLAHRKLWKAEDGQRGGSNDCHGASGSDLIIPVPVGTVVRDAEENFVIKDLVQPGDRVVVARGGKGGKGNAAFKSPTNRAPRIATPGQEGEIRRLILELKVIADVGLVGKPNAGKSTLLSRLTRARPKIAPYPFTTKYPNLGRVMLDWHRSFVIADIPGLIEGAHAGAGLGHEFLRHIQRAGILVHLVEPEPLDGSCPIENYRVIREELNLYDPALLERPELVVVTKADLPGAAEVREQLAQAIGRPVLLISAVTGQGLDELLREIVRLLERAGRLPPVTPGT